MPIVITSFGPVAAAPGQLVTITGTGFIGATDVQFGGVSAIFFRVISDTTIQAYPNINGNGTVAVFNALGNTAIAGFTKIITKVSLPNSPDLGRQVATTDLVWVWDSVRNILTKAPASVLPGGPGGIGPGGPGGSGGGTTGNIYTALGSPFKTRVTDFSYAYDAVNNNVTITDVRLLGKIDYVVYATDMNVEFEDWFTPAATATGAGITPTADGIQIAQPAINLTGNGVGATFTVTTVGNVASAIVMVAGGMGYEVGDTFQITNLPNIVFTIATVGPGIGQLEYDAAGGAVIIHNYQLTPGCHITITCDGVVS